jgi:hypothetical protein
MLVRVVSYQIRFSGKTIFVAVHNDFCCITLYCIADYQNGPATDRGAMKSRYAHMAFATPISIRQPAISSSSCLPHRFQRPELFLPRPGFVPPVDLSIRAGAAGAIKNDSGVAQKNQASQKTLVQL